MKSVFGKGYSVKDLSWTVTQNARGKTNPLVRSYRRPSTQTSVTQAVRSGKEGSSQELKKSTERKKKQSKVSSAISSIDLGYVADLQESEQLDADTQVKKKQTRQHLEKEVDEDIVAVPRFASEGVADDDQKLKKEAEGELREVEAEEKEEDVFAQPWHSIESAWECNEVFALETGIMNALCSPTWRIMLLSDGSVTRHLQLLTDIQVEVQCIDQEVISADTQGLPPCTRLIPGPLIQRQVFLMNSVTKEKLVYATSWWPKEEMDNYMKEMGLPIWVNLQAQRAELYRQLSRIYLGQCPHLHKEFSDQDERLMWGRHYIFYHNGRPLTVIYEVFSNNLEKYLGPSLLKQNLPFPL